MRIVRKIIFFEIVYVGLSSLAVKNNDVREVYLLGLVLRRWDLLLKSLIGAVWRKEDRLLGFV